MLTSRRCAAPRVAPQFHSPRPTIFALPGFRGGRTLAPAPRRKRATGRSRAMITARQLNATDEPAAPATQDLTLRTPPNWTAVCFFLALSGLHLSIAIPAFYHH